jgi:hypothetical protein
MTTRKTEANIQCQVEENHIHFSKPKFAEMLINQKKFFYWSTKCWSEILLINKNSNMGTHQNVDQQNLDLEFCWSTKCPPQILLINKILIFQYYLLPGGSARAIDGWRRFCGTTSCACRQGGMG